MASLHITPLGGNEYEFEASGCPSSHLVIWHDGENSVWYPFDKNKSKNYYLQKIM